MADDKPTPSDDESADPATEELVAYLDGELDAKQAEAMASRMGLDAGLRAEADSLQRTWDILDILPRPQPSAAFATRTVSQLVPISAASGLQGASQTALIPPVPQAHAAFWIVSVILIAASGLGGYFGHRAYSPPPKAVSAEPPLEDYPLMKNLRLYRDVDDIEYLKKLDTPEQFGQED